MICGRRQKHIEAAPAQKKLPVLPLNGFSTIPGASLGHKIIPVNSCCYVPGGGLPSFFIGPDVNYTGKNCRC